MYGLLVRNRTLLYKAYPTVSAHILIEMLKLETTAYYKIKEGQTLREIAVAFSVADRLLVKENGLTAEPKPGQILKIPRERGNG